MRNGLWVVTVFVAAVLAVLVGYVVSSETGVEPGYFDSAEAGGYGATGDSGGGAAGIGAEDENYYKNLSVQ